MYNVQFPQLGWEFNINPVAFRIGDRPVMWYGILIMIGLALAVVYAIASCKKMRIDSDKLLNCVLAGVIGGVIGARLYYVLFFPGDQYIKDPLSILYIWEGGLGIYGGIIGGMLVGGITAKICHMSVASVLDVASIGFLIGQGIGRWGNFVNQEAFGTPTTLPWGMQSAYTGNQAVHPCFLYESLWCLLGFLLLHIFTRKLRRYDGQTFLLYLAWYGLGRFFIEGLRTDSLLTPVIDLRVSQLVAAGTVLVSVVLLVIFAIRKKSSLTGCGAKKVMEMNAIYDEVRPEDIDDGVSTIFPDAPVITEDSVNASEPRSEKTEEEEAVALIESEPENAEPVPMETAPEESSTAEDTGDAGNTEQE